MTSSSFWAQGGLQRAAAMARSQVRFWLPWFVLLYLGTFCWVFWWGVGDLGHSWFRPWVTAHLKGLVCSTCVVHVGTDIHNAAQLAAWLDDALFGAWFWYAAASGVTACLLGVGLLFLYAEWPRSDT